MATSTPGDLDDEADRPLLGFIFQMLPMWATIPRTVGLALYSGSTPS